MFHVKHFSVAMQSCQQEKLQSYAKLLQNYNQRLNLLSRRTMPEGFWGHIQECLVFAELGFSPGSSLVDWGTGGGLPAIPIAVMLPDVKVYAVDAAQKKIRAVNVFKRKLSLPNLYPWHGRAEDFPFTIQHSVSRATASLRVLWDWHTHAATPEGSLYCLKGGDMSREREHLAAAYPKAEIKLRPVQDSLRFVVQIRSFSPPAGRESREPPSPREPSAQ